MRIKHRKSEVYLLPDESLDIIFHLDGEEVKICIGENTLEDKDRFVKVVRDGEWSKEYVFVSDLCPRSSTG